MSKKQPNLKSTCCNAKVKIVGNVTMYYVCCKCGNPCDVRYVQRKTWARNPVTQITPDKRDKIIEKLEKQQIKEYFD